MHPVSTCTVALLLTAMLAACGEQGPAPGSAGDAEQAARIMFDGLANGDASALCEAVDLREAYAALGENERASMPFDTFAAKFRASCPTRAAEIYRVGSGEHQVVGTYQDAGRTIVKVRVRPSKDAAWREWDLPFRHIDGTWQMGREAIATVFANRPERVADAPTDNPPAADAVADAPQVREEPRHEPAARPTRVVSERQPAPDGPEHQALEEARRIVARGGDLDEPLPDGQLLQWPAHSMTRLHKAAEAGWKTVCVYLVENGANLGAVAATKSHYNDVTPIEVARHAGHAALATYLEGIQKQRQALVRKLDLSFPNPGRAGALVSFDRNRIRIVTQDMEGQRVDDDLFIDPPDPEIMAFTKAFEGLVHVGKDAAIAVAGYAFGSLQRVPPSIDWAITVPRHTIAPGAVFLVRSSSGKLYKFQLEQCDKDRVAMRYAPLIAPGPTDTAVPGTAPSRSGAADRQAVRDVAQAFVRASQKGQVDAAAALCIGDAARALRKQRGEGAHRPTISEYDVRQVDVTGDRGTADVWVRNNVFPEGQDEFTLTLRLARANSDWRIEGLELAPHWEPEDLGPEVDR